MSACELCGVDHEAEEATADLRHENAALRSEVARLTTALRENASLTKAEDGLPCWCNFPGSADLLGKHEPWCVLARAALSSSRSDTNNATKEE